MCPRSNKGSIEGGIFAHSNWNTLLNTPPRVFRSEILRYAQNDIKENIVIASDQSKPKLQETMRSFITTKFGMYFLYIKDKK